jgi:hypothetical protein
MNDETISKIIIDEIGFLDHKFLNYLKSELKKFLELNQLTLHEKISYQKKNDNLFRSLRQEGDKFISPPYTHPIELYTISCEMTKRIINNMPGGFKNLENCVLNDWCIVETRKYKKGLIKN